MRTILETIHGSHLYGLAHARSDVDTYRVVLPDEGHRRTYARQRKVNKDDRLVISLDRFLDQVALGVPQALEALWSPEASIDPTWVPFLHGLRPGLEETRMRYRRTIVNFGFHHGGRTGAAAREIDGFKLHRHAVRLCLNLQDFLTTGGFCPRLSPERAQYCNEFIRREDYDTALEQLLQQAQSALR